MFSTCCLAVLIYLTGTVTDLKTKALTRLDGFCPKEMENRASIQTTETAPLDTFMVKVPMPSKYKFG